jgi:hypothetical protein
MLTTLFYFKNVAVAGPEALRKAPAEDGSPDQDICHPILGNPIDLTSNRLFSDGSTRQEESFI